MKILNRKRVLTPEGFKALNLRVLQKIINYLEISEELVDTPKQYKVKDLHIVDEVLNFDARELEEQLHFDYRVFAQINWAEIPAQNIIEVVNSLIHMHFNRLFGDNNLELEYRDLFRRQNERRKYKYSEDISKDIKSL